MKTIQLVIEVEDVPDDKELLDVCQEVAFEGFGGELLSLVVDSGPGPNDYEWRRGS